MRTDTHLTAEDALRLYLVPEDSQHLQSHVDRCPRCADQLTLLIGSLREQASDTRLLVQSLPEEFWRQQRQQIQMRIRASEGRIQERRGFLAGFLDLRVWAGVAAVLIFSITLLQWTPPAALEAPDMVSQLSEMDAKDDQLLLEINEEILQDPTDSLRPLELLIALPESSIRPGDKGGEDGTSS